MPKFALLTKTDQKANQTYFNERDSEIIDEKIDNKAEELVNNVIENAVVHLSNEYRQSEIAATDDIEIEEEKPNAPREKRSLDVLLKIPSQDKNNPQRCPACGYALSEGTLQESLSDSQFSSATKRKGQKDPSHEKSIQQQNLPRTSTEHSVATISPDLVRENLFGFHRRWWDNRRRRKVDDDDDDTALQRR